MKNWEVRWDCVKTGPYVELEAGIRSPSREGPRAETKHKSHRGQGGKLSANQAGSFTSEDCFG